MGQRLPWLLLYTQLGQRVVLEFLEFTHIGEKGKSQKYMVSCTEVH